MPKIILAALFVLFSFIPSYAQQSQVIDLGEGFLGRIVQVEDVVAVQVRFPESAFENGETYKDGVVYAINAVFYPDLLKKGEVITIRSSIKPEPFYLYFDTGNKRVIIMGLTCETDRVCGVVFRVIPKPPII